LANFSSADKLHERLQPLHLIFFIFIVLGSTLVLITQKLSVNMLFWDQWDYYRPLFDHLTWWQTFDHQDGTHRHGVGLILARIFMQATSWNSRSESFFYLLFVLLNALAAVKLKLKFSGRLVYADVFIPALFLIPAQLESVILVPKLCHSIMPLFLILTIGMVWLERDGIARTIGIITVSFLLLFTGYGYTAIPAVCALLIIELCQDVLQKRRSQFFYSTLTLIAMSLSIILFFKGYSNQEKVGSLPFPHRPLLDYATFAFLMYSTFCGFAARGLGNGGFPLPLAICCAIGGFVLLGSLVQFYFVASRVKNNLRSFPNRKDEVLLLLMGSTLFYAAATVAGRVDLGLAGAQSARYMCLLIPGIFASYLLVTGTRPAWIRRAYWFLMTAVICCCFGSFYPHRYSEFQYYADIKTRWKDCYLKIENVDACDDLTHAKVYPNPNATNIQKKLLFFKENHLNLYLDAKHT
jgi:hypothetical protein